jgi:hypothetical protein
MTYIDVGGDNSTPKQNMVRADRVELFTGLLRFADAAADADAVRSLSVRFAYWTIPSPSTTSPLKLWLGRRFFYQPNSLSTTGCGLNACNVTLAAKVDRAVPPSLFAWRAVRI